MIELTGIQRDYTVGGQLVRALAGLDLTIGAGDYVAIMGPSGSGKSTLMHILGLLDRPTAGRYLLQGVAVGHLGEGELARLRRETFGFVFQFFHLVPRLSAADNVALPLVLAGVPPAERLERVARALEDFGLRDRAHHRPDQLSGGQRQRVAIARATILSPAVILADEPTGNLDQTTGQEVVAILEGLHARGVAILLVTHDPALGRRAARRVRMVDGRITRIEQGASS